MRYLLPLFFTAMAMPLAIARAQAMDTTTQSLVITGYVTSQVTTAPFDRKLVRQARDDAAAFVASDGMIRGARLEAAQDAQRHHCHHSVGDLELAEAILVQ